MITATKTAVKLWFIYAGDLIQPQDKGKGEVANRRFIPPLIPRDRYHLQNHSCDKKNVRCIPKVVKCDTKIGKCDDY